MKIDKIESFFIGGGYVVRIHTDNGISGIGLKPPVGAILKRSTESWQPLKIPNRSEPPTHRTPLAISLSYGSVSRHRALWCD